MSEAPLRRKIKVAHDLQSVVRTMKAMAAASIGPYERAVAALADYYRTVELGLVAALRRLPGPVVEQRRSAMRKIGAIVFGTDQGMVGQFNERLAELVSATLPSLGKSGGIWVVGERIESRLRDAGWEVTALLQTPHSVVGITSVVSELLVAIQQRSERDGLNEVHVFHNRPRRRATYDPVRQRLMPLDVEWRHALDSIVWPTRALPEIIAGHTATLDALVREFLFVSLFRACAESLAAESARRFVTMQGAERNINELLSALTLSYHHRRQAAIDEELFDLIAGYEALRSQGPLHT